MENLRKRSQIEKKYKWDLEAMYESHEAWQKDVDDALEMTEGFLKFSGHLAERAETLAEALKVRDDISRKLEKAFAYARMKLDEDNGDSAQQAMLGKISSVIADVSASMSFFIPQILSSPEEKIRKYLDSCEELKQYGFLIKDILREKAHMLSEGEESLLAQLSEVTDSFDSVFTMLNNADMKFGTITNEKGEETPLTHGSYNVLIKSYDRDVRKAAYIRLYETYRGLINTIAALYNYSVKADVIAARIRKYASSRQAALSGGNIPEEVYDNLISVVNEYLPVMHRYLRLRKKALGIDDMMMYDIHVPLVELPKKDIPYKEAVSIMKDALSPLGEEYIARLSKGVESGWIDVYENERKTSGAYSFGSYDSYPYILLNYTGTLTDVFTLVHEMGHSMHSSYTRENQPFVYGGHSVFTAEVASTVNEALLMRRLFEKEQDKKTRTYLLNMYIESFRTTLFRQTMFAEFEHNAHKYSEGGGSLTAEWLCNEYERLNRKYHGPALGKDGHIRYEWARIPHFYRSFYVYQYATGYSAAMAISGKILKEGAPARDAYLEFLKTGSSSYPMDLLKVAGIDMSGREPVTFAAETFTALVDELEEIL